MKALYRYCKHCNWKESCDIELTQKTLRIEAMRKCPNCGAYFLNEKDILTIANIKRVEKTSRLINKFFAAIGIKTKKVHIVVKSDTGKIESV